jgi:hypothetical protein
MAVGLVEAAEHEVRVADTVVAVHELEVIGAV